MAASMPPPPRSGSRSCGVQEALRNTKEHAQAKKVRLTVEAQPGRTVAEVRDDGRGFDVERTLARATRDGQLGLAGIAERADARGQRAGAKPPRPDVGDNQPAALGARGRSHAFRQLGDGELDGRQRSVSRQILDQPVLLSPPSRFGAVADLELAEDVGEVELDRVVVTQRCLATAWFERPAATAFSTAISRSVRPSPSPSRTDEASSNGA